VTSVPPIADLLRYHCLHVKKNISAKIFQVEVM
jgi:hypothetical protein